MEGDFLISKSQKNLSEALSSVELKMWEAAVELTLMNLVYSKEASWYKQLHQMSTSFLLLYFIVSV